MDRRFVLKPYASSEHPHFNWAVSGPCEDGHRRWRRLFSSREEADEFLREERGSPGTDVPSKPNVPPVLGSVGQDLHPVNQLRGAEMVFLGCIAATIFASSWLLGGKSPWAQWTMLALSALSFLTGALNFLLSANSRSRSFAKWRGWWVSGLAAVGFVAFVSIQAVNLSHTHVIGDNVCVLTPIPHHPLLPSSISGPFAGFAYGFIAMENAGRYALIYGAAILGALAMMLGIQSRRGLELLLKVLVFHGVLSALICAAHQWSGSTSVLWIRSDSLEFLGAPFFFNKNQNAAYQALLTGFMLLVASRYVAAAGAARKFLGVLVAFIGILGLASIRSRAGLLFAGILGAVWLYQHRAAIGQASRARRFVVTSVLVAMLLFGSLSFWKTGGMRTVQRFAEEKISLRAIFHGGEYRQLLHEIALEMFKDRPWYGWGAAGYFYAYSQYERKVPEMASNRPGFSYYLLTGHADGDWFEFLAEFGLIGTALFAVIWVPHLLIWARRRLWRDRFLVAPALAVALVLWHGLIDQSFRHVGLLFLHLGTAVLTSKLVLLKSSQVRSRSREAGAGAGGALH